MKKTDEVLKTGFSDFLERYGLSIFDFAAYFKIKKPFLVTDVTRVHDWRQKIALILLLDQKLISLLGSPENANHFLNSKNIGLGGTPLDIIRQGGDLELIIAYLDRFLSR